MKGTVLGKGSYPRGVSPGPETDWREGEDGREAVKQVNRKMAGPGSAGKGRASDNTSDSCPQHTPSSWMDPVLPVCVYLEKEPGGRMAQV